MEDSIKEEFQDSAKSFTEEMQQDINTTEQNKKEEVSGVSVDIKIGTKDMFYFFMRHNYACFSGIFSLFISIGAALLFIIRFQQYDITAKCLLAIVALLFTVIQPLQLLLKAANQIKRTPMFHEPIHYTFREDGLELSQHDQNGMIPWDQIMKIIDTGTYLIIYITRMRAYIFPKNQMKELDKINEMIQTYCH